MWKIIVCGGRDFDNYDIVADALDEYLALNPLIIHGGSRGADCLAGAWARANGVTEVHVPANWEEHGRAAGPIRNSAMLQLKPDLVVAFPGGRGTADMIDKAQKKGVTVRLIGHHA